MVSNFSLNGAGARCANASLNPLHFITYPSSHPFPNARGWMNPSGSLPSSDKRDCCSFFALLKCVDQEGAEDDEFVLDELGIGGAEWVGEGVCDVDDALEVREKHHRVSEERNSLEYLQLPPGDLDGLDDTALFV